MDDGPRLLEGFTHRAAERHGEVRLPASAAVVLAALGQALLPDALLVVPRWVLPVIEIALLVPLVAINPNRLTTETRWSRIVSLALTALIIVTNLVALGFLLHDLVGSTSGNGRQLLLGALEVWLTNMIAFALVFWDLDRGGAGARLPSSAVPSGRADFRFPQDSDASTDEAPPWMPVFLDYLFLSITNSTAFSPTDTLPLTSRAKLLMSVQALTAMITSLLVVARAVNILK